MTKKSILVCDDEEDILNLIQLVLGQTYDVVLVAAVTDVVALVKEIQPNLIMMDIWIPEVGGEKAVAQLKEDKATQNIPVLFLSGHSDTQLIAQRAGADGYITKPFEIMELKETIASYLSSTD